MPDSIKHDEIRVISSQNTINAISISDDVVFFGDKALSQDSNTSFFIEFSQKPVCIVYTHTNDHRISFSYEIKKCYSNEVFLHDIIIQSIITKLVSSPAQTDFSLNILRTDNMHFLEKVLLEHNFKFSTNDQLYTLSIDHIPYKPFIEIKQSLRDLCIDKNKYGRGYCIDAEAFDFDKLNLVQSEYNKFFWGTSNVAWQNTVTKTELEVINTFATGTCGLEVGCGSGRVTKHLLNRFKTLYVTDYIDEAVNKAKNSLPHSHNIKFIKDDILKSQFNNTFFDVVMFWENGLGSILQKKQRKKALHEMGRILKNNGLLILGLRKLPESPIDHLMISTTNPDFMGIYHTFTANEINSILSTNFKLQHNITGESRPAGGSEFYLIFQKESKQ